MSHKLKIRKEKDSGSNMVLEVVFYLDLQTGDLTALFYQMKKTKKWLGLVGLEPTILPLWAVRFNQLNYKPLRIFTYAISSRVEKEAFFHLYFL